jgi:hypothetical protein
VLLPDCGHLSQPEQPEAVAAALVEWLRSDSVFERKPAPDLIRGGPRFA